MRAIQERYRQPEAFKSENETVEEYRARCLQIKEERASMVKHHLWVLWSDYFKPSHLKAHPRLHDLFWQATKAASAAKRSQDPGLGHKLLELVDEIADIFRATKRGD